MAESPKYLVDDRVRQAQALMDSDPDEAHKICMSVLDDSPDDPVALFIVASIYADAGKYALAYHLFKRCTELAPNRDEPWNNLGMALESMRFHTRARQAFQEATKRNGKNAGYWANIAMTWLNQGDRKKAIQHAKHALSIDPDHSGAWQSLGFASLGEGDWLIGWKGYNYALGGKYRKELSIAEEPRWDGKPVESVYCYGEQGVGDEVLGASCIADLARDVGHVYLECDPRLASLFERSFSSLPNVSVHGTRRVEHPAWAKSVRPAARVGVMQLPMFYRPNPESCPGTPFLVADEERRIQWRALFDSFGRRPKIGIAWSGGRKHTNAAERKVGLAAFRPLFDKIDADWVSLQYSDPSEEIEAEDVAVHNWQRACGSGNFDDLAGMIAELDMVIGVHTASLHLAGAMGVPTVALVPSKALWIWALDPMPWYSSIQCWRQKENEPWNKTMERLANDSCLDRVRSPRSNRVSRLQSVDHQARAAAGVDSPAGAVAAA